MPCKMERYFFYLLYLLLGCSLCGCSRKQAPKQAQDPDTETTIPYADTIAAPVPPAPVKSRTARYLDSLGFVNIAEADSSIAIDLMYTRADNFTGTLLYEDLKEAYLHPDACKQDYQQQLSWIDSVLTAAKEDWVIVAGHHPIYAETPKDESERADMQARLDPILRKHKVDMYICGHIHNFQHVRVAGSDIDYITNSAGSLARKVKPIEGTVFCSPEPGFSIVSASKKTLELRMIDKKGNVLHTVTRSK